MKKWRTDPSDINVAAIILLIAAVLVFLLSMPCCTTGRHKAPARKGEEEVGGAPHPGHYVEEGIASWYGEDFHGRPTASGEVYDMYKLTAAHKTLPLGVTAKVTRLDNNRTVKVKVNDRGPFVKDRVIDLSYGAARSLGMVEEGVILVRIEVEGFKTLDEFPYFVQVGSYKEQSNAMLMKERLSSLFNDVVVVESGGLYKVRVGACDTEEEARALAERLKEAGYDGFVAR